ncbi:hypothetical protein CPB97_008772 [Podila verticillata]|nr:hypothetical protein CPB97_008772 [Podila verticillata]
MAANKLTLHQWLEAPQRSPAPGPPNNDTDLVHAPWAQNIKKGLPSDPIDIYRDPQWHGSAISSILTKSASLAKFYPAAGLSEAANNFKEYIIKVSTFPGFTVEQVEETGKHETKVDVDKFVDDIVDAYTGILTADVAKVKKSVTDMASSILSYSSKTAHKGIFTQSTVDNENDTFTTTIFFATLDMASHGGKYKYTEQQYSIQRAVFHVNGPWLAAHAKELVEKIDGKSIDDWLEDSSSPKGSQKSCIEQQLEKGAAVGTARALHKEL